MSVLKYYNPTTEAWEPATIGKQGPTGATGASGVITTTAPITNSGTSTSANIGIDQSQLASVSGNAIINGAFDIWQRGTSISIPAAATGYTSDRWHLATAVNQAMTVSRQSVADSSSLPDIRFAARVQRNSGQTGTGASNFDQFIETSNSIPLVGKSVKVSFYARKGADFSSNSWYVQLISGTGVDQNIGNASGISVLTNFVPTLTTTWQRFSVTATVSSTATQLFLRIGNTPTGTAGANDWYEITGVQVEAGAVATPFKRNANSIQGELAACQRYYFRTRSGAFSPFGSALGYTTTAAVALVNLPVTMRVVPSAVEFSTLGLGDGLTLVAATNIALSERNPDYVSLIVTAASGVVAGKGYLLQQNNSGTAFLAFSAEL
jgi:hypothetical protein